MSQSSPRSLVAAISSSWVSFGVSALTALIMTPVLVERLGAGGYGLWSLYMSLTGYFSLLDFGISPAVVRYTSAYAARGDLAGQKRVVGLALSLFTLGAGGVLVLVGGAAWGYEVLFPALGGQVSLTAGRLTFVLVSLDFALSLPCAVFQGVLLGHQRWVWSNSLNLGVRLIRFALVLGWMGRGDEGLIQVALIFTGTGMLRSLGLFGLARRALGFSPGLQPLEADGVRELLAYSLPAFVLAISLRVISYTDALVIGYRLGVEAITPFALAVSLVDYVQELGWGLTGVLVPVVSALDARGALREVQERFLSFTRYCVWLMGVVGGVAAVCAEPFFHLWVGPAAAQSPRLLGVLLTSMSIYVVMMPGQAVLKGIGRHRRLALYMGLEAVLNLGLSLWWAGTWGLMGVALGTLVPRVLVGGLLFARHVVTVLEVPLKRWLREGLLPGLLPGGVIAGLAWGIREALPGGRWEVLPGALRFAGAPGWLALVLLGAGMASACLLAVGVLGLNAQERQGLLAQARARLWPRWTG